MSLTFTDHAQVTLQLRLTTGHIYIYILGGRQQSEPHVNVFRRSVLAWGARKNCCVTEAALDHLHTCFVIGFLSRLL